MFRGGNDRHGEARPVCTWPCALQNFRSIIVDGENVGAQAHAVLKEGSTRLSPIGCAVGSGKGTQASRSATSSISASAALTERVMAYEAFWRSGQRVSR